MQTFHLAGLRNSLTPFYPAVTAGQRARARNEQGRQRRSLLIASKFLLCAWYEKCLQAVSNLSFDNLHVLNRTGKGLLIPLRSLGQHDLRVLWYMWQHTVVLLKQSDVPYLQSQYMTYKQRPREGRLTSTVGFLAAGSHFSQQLPSAIC